MTNLPLDAESKIGKPQVIARLLEIDGRQVLIRLQKPFEEPPEDYTVLTTNKAGKRVIEARKAPVYTDDSWIQYGTALIVEAWSDATKSIVTTGIKKPHDKTEEEFAFGCRYMLNHSSDTEIIHILRLKRLDFQLKYQLGEDETAAILPTPPKLEKKKPT
jgi:hypothetical protein